LYFIILVVHATKYTIVKNIERMNKSQTIEYTHKEEKKKKKHDKIRRRKKLMSLYTKKKKFFFVLI